MTATANVTLTLRCIACGYRETIDVSLDEFPPFPACASCRSQAVISQMVAVKAERKP